MNNQYVREVDLFELLVEILKRWRLVLGLVVLFALLAGGYKGFADFRKLTDENYIKNQREKADEEQAKYEELKALYEAQLNNIKSEIEKQNQYLDNSLYLNIDPYNEYQEVLSYYITTDYQIMPGMTYQNINPRKSIVNAYAIAADNDSVYKNAAVKIEDSLDIAYLRELVNIQQDTDNGILTFMIVGSDERVTSAIAEEIQNSINTNRANITESIGEHTIEEAAHSARYGVDTGLVDALTKVNDNITKLQDAEVKRRKELNDLTKPSITLMSRSSVMKNTVKYTLLGAILGGIAACIWISVQFVTGDRIPNERDLKHLFNLPVLGKCYDVPSGKLLSTLDREIESLEGIRKEDYDTSKALAITAAGIANIAGNEEKILLLGSIETEKLQEIYSRLLEIGDLNQDRFFMGGNILKDPEAIRKLNEADSVVFVENRKTSSARDLAKEIDNAKRQEKRILGIVEIG